MTDESIIRVAFLLRLTLVLIPAAGLAGIFAVSTDHAVGLILISTLAATVAAQWALDSGIFYRLCCWLRGPNG